MTLHDRMLLDKWRVAVAIEDAALAELRITVGFRVEYLDTGKIPPDVVAYCRWIEQFFKKEGRE